MNITEPNNPYPLPKETISNREILSSINSFKSTKRDNNNNNTAINKKRINTNLNKAYILPEGLKREKKA